MQVKIKINGKLYDKDVEPRLLLTHFIRDVAGLTGTHVGCETSICGACTVLANGLAVKSCTIFTVQADGADVVTIEGMSKDGRLQPLQERLTMTQRYVGQAMKRKEDPRLVSGTSTYVDDVVLPGMLHMAVTRSMHAHARIKRIDTSKAQKLPGVVAVVTGEEVAAHC